MFYGTCIFMFFQFLSIYMITKVLKIIYLKVYIFSLIFHIENICFEHKCGFKIF